MAAREIRSWLMDMDGVLVHEEEAIPGADRFIAALRERELPFLVLTNNSIYTRRDLAARLRASGLDVPEASIWTSALATAGFLADHRLGRRVDQPRDGRRALLRRQAEPADDALGAQRDRRALGDDGDDRRPHGHRRRVGARGGGGGARRAR